MLSLEPLSAHGSFHSGDGHQLTRSNQEDLLACTELTERGVAALFHQGNPQAAVGEPGIGLKVVEVFAHGWRLPIVVYASLTIGSRHTHTQLPNAI